MKTPEECLDVTCWYTVWPWASEKEEEARKKLPVGSWVTFTDLFKRALKEYSWLEGSKRDGYYEGKLLDEKKIFLGYISKYHEDHGCIIIGMEIEKDMMPKTPIELFLCAMQIKRSAIKLNMEFTVFCDLFDMPTLPKDVVLILEFFGRETELLRRETEFLRKKIEEIEDMATGTREKLDGKIRDEAAYEYRREQEAKELATSRRLAAGITYADDLYQFGLNVLGRRPKSWFGPDYG